MNCWLRIIPLLHSSAAEYVAALRDTRGAQERLLRDILAVNQGSCIGVRYDFAAISSYAEYAARVPRACDEDIQCDLKAYICGEPRLASEPVLFYEETSGTTQAVKCIPFTARKLLSFERALHPWLLDLVQHYPAVCDGRMYWSVSPPARGRGVQGFPVPRGIGDDALYFGADVAQLLSVVTVGRDAARGSYLDLDEWRIQTLVELLLADDLAMFSIWSPTFLLELIRFLREHLNQVLARVAARSSARADILLGWCTSRAIDTRRVWPKLALISCWADAAAQRFIPALQRAFPDVPIQGKGVLATEAVVTLPWASAGGCLPAVLSSFLEFVADDGSVQLCDELQRGRSYRVLVTTYGGLYRYDLGDYLEVIDFYNGVPVLRFVGRGSLVSDLCGEKLSERFAAHCLQDIEGFAMLVPEDDPARNYVLLLDAAVIEEARSTEIVERVEGRLQENPHYRYARELLQLQPLRVVRVANPQGRYESECVRRGQTLGAIKQLALSSQCSMRELLTQ